MKRFGRFRDPRFALATLQNPLMEVRTCAELVQAAQRERENQLGAAPIPAPQAPASPEPVPAAQIPATQEPTGAAPLPAHLAPLDSASLDYAIPNSENPDSPNPDSPNDDAQQLLDSLVADVITAGASLPSLSSRDDQATTHTTPKSRRKPKTKSHRKSKARRSPAPPAEYQELAPDDLPEPTPLERHARKCSICNSPYREYIEEAFLQWRSPDTITRCWNIPSRTAICHHIHAFNLFALRNRNLQLALGNIIEHTDTQGCSARDILHAIRVLAHINGDGRSVDPTNKSEVIVSTSTQRLPAVAGLPAAAGEPNLIATQIFRYRCNPLKTITTDPC